MIWVLWTVLFSFSSIIFYFIFVSCQVHTLNVDVLCNGPHKSSNSISTLSFMAEFAHYPLQSLFLLSCISESSPVVLDYLHSSIQIVRIEDSRLYLFSFHFILNLELVWHHMSHVTVTEEYRRFQNNDVIPYIL